MLLIRYLLEEFDKQVPETRVDIILAIQDGARTGALSPLQVHVIIRAAYGYTSVEIANRLHKPIGYIEMLLNAGLAYLEEKTGYRDESVLYSRYGKVEPQWIAKSRKLAMEWN